MFENNWFFFVFEHAIMFWCLLFFMVFQDALGSQIRETMIKIG